MYYAFIVTARWLAVWLDATSLCLLSVAAFGSIALKSTLSAGAVGLGLSLLMQLTGLVQWLIRQVHSLLFSSHQHADAHKLRI